MTLLADSLCVGGEASADYWSTSEENQMHETERLQKNYTVIE